MVRLATYHDVPWIVEQMLKLKAQTAWAQVEGEYTYDTLTRFVTERICSRDSVCFVWDDVHGELSAFCGGTRNRFYLPPYMPNVYEWGIGGRVEHAQQCWLALRKWAKRHGAQWIGRVKAKPGKSSKCVIENVVWKVL